MPAFFIYLLKVNTALLLFYLVYRFVLRRLTFYNANRVYLLFAIATSSIFPLVHIQWPASQTARPAELMYYTPHWETVSVSVTHAGSQWSVWGVLYIVYWTGVAVMLLVFLHGLMSLIRIYRNSHKQNEPSLQLRFSEKNIVPFSFWNMIFVNPAKHDAAELQTILEHEAVHAREKHSADLVLAELNKIFYWFNPGAWLMKNAIRENLEFIADDTVLRSGKNVQHYQYSLLQTATGLPVANGITSRFAFSNLKNRIMMMNKKRSARPQRLRYLLLLPLLVVVAVVMARQQKEVNNRAAVRPVTAAITDSVPGGPSKTIQWNKAAFNKKGYVVAVQTAENKSVAVAFGRNNKVAAKLPLNAGDEAIKAFEEKYGKIPPPPPPVKAGERLPSGDNYIVTADTIMWMNNDGRASGYGNITLKGLPADMLYLLDGSVTSHEKIVLLNPQFISRIDVLKNTKAVQQYGEAGRNGVIIITTKPPMSNDGGASGYGNVTLKGLPADVLYVLDGSVTSHEKIALLNPQFISRIDVLKNTKAVQQYGEAGRNGVIIITTKPQTPGNGEVVVMGYPVKPQPVANGEVVPAGYPAATKSEAVVTGFPAKATGPNQAAAENDLPVADTQPKRPLAPDVYAKVEVEAKFKSSFKEFLIQNLRYPARAMDQNAKGVVVIQFVVDKNGAVSDVVLDEASPVKNLLLAAEAKRIIALSTGNWVPAVQKGKPVKAYHRQAINFVLQED
jgi:beta-lactamase regulating signal transducer with metallopeptidase domain